MKKVFIIAAVSWVCLGSRAGISLVGAPQVGSVSTTGGAKTNTFTVIAGDVIVMGMGSNKSYDPARYGISTVIGGSGTARIGTSYASTTGSEKFATYINTFPVTTDGTLEIELPQIANQSTIYAGYVLRADSGSIGVVGSASDATSTAPASGLSLGYAWAESFSNALLIETVSAHKDQINDKGGWDKGSGSSSTSTRMVDHQVIDDTYTSSAFDFTDVDGGDDATGLGVAFVELSTAPLPPTFNSDSVMAVDAFQDLVYVATLLDDVSDPNGDVMTFFTTNGPSWLTVETHGALSGTPLIGDLGTNSWTVFVTDGNSGTNSATLNIKVQSGAPVPQTSATNIVLIVIDDLGWMDLSIQGSEFYETPRIDSLATNGMRFTQGYASHPRCLPSRYGLMTGRFPGASAVPADAPDLIDEEVTIGEALQAGGYATFFGGKWHISHEDALLPQRQGFGVNISGGAAGAPPTYFFPYKKTGEPDPINEFNKNALFLDNTTPIGGMVTDRITGASYRRTYSAGESGEYITDRLTDEALDWMVWNADQPMFLYMSHYGVHTPFEAPASLVAKYEAKLASMDYGDTPATISVGVGEQKMRQDHPTYAAMIESVDTNVGRLIDKVQELGISSNTIFIFTSDNGGLSNRGGNNNRTLATSNYPLRTGKGWLYEGGIREAFIVKGPGVTSMVNSIGVVNGTDIYPTILELTGQPLRPLDHRNGVSFKSALSGAAYDRGAPILWHSPLARPYSTGDFNSSALRDGDYKLIWWYDTPGQNDEFYYELYNVKTDPGETIDLAYSMPAKAADLLAQIKAWHNHEHWERSVGVIKRTDEDDVSKPPKDYLDDPAVPLSLNIPTLSWQNYLGFDYNLFSKTNLTDVAWTPEVSGITSIETNLPMVGSEGFYKVELSLQLENK